VLHEAWSPVMARFLKADRDAALTGAIVDKAGAVDGVTARNEPTVDGFPAKVHAEVIEGLRRVAWGKAAD
jgi:hypothetical protein